MAASDEPDRGTHTPLPDEFEHPRPNFGVETPRDSTYSTSSTPNNSSPLISQQKYEGEDDETRKEGKPGKRRPLILALIAFSVLAIVVLAVVLPVYFVVVKQNQKNNNAASTSGSQSGDAGSGSVGGGKGNPQSPSGATSGGDGSKIVTEDGETFIYNNKFGGFWVYDPLDPYNNNARPNSWTPPLNQTWDFSRDRIYGVNLGGLFVIEPFIVPRFFEKYPNAVDEYTLSQAMAADTASGGGLSQLEEHYKTFVTEKDIAEIAGAGLNWIRLPVPYWAIDTWPGEPFLAKTSWKYILRLLGWARKYGLRVNLDLHTIPGSQNGYNHSGKGGQINFLNGVMGIANAQRALNYIRIFTEFISQPEYNNLVPMFGIINEALVATIGKDVMTSFYLEAHNMMRSITGFGQGKGPYISIHDGFTDISSWSGFLTGADRFVLDTHPYFSFGGGLNVDPIATGTGIDAGGIWPGQACNAWGPSVNKSRSGFGVTVAGEFSNGYNDCGLFLKGVPGGHTYGGDCGVFQDSSNWNDTLKAGIKAFAMASMDATQDWFFWTWKIGNSSANNRVEAPLWSYQLGYQNGWMPIDPREANGYCGKLGVNEPFNGQYQGYMTGGAGAGTIAAAATAGLSWPPVSINGIPAASMAFAPTYTPTGSVVTLEGPSVTKGASSVKGWFNTADNAGAPTTIPGCSYPDGWNAQGANLPATQCGAGGAAAATAPAAARTVPPAQVTDDVTRRRR